ncbi:unnamed protein product [Linum trigynum]|uniref:DNA mismatch repair proteins mutS family domain-containing protein n=1 Tax=Linum trigynum TaxID=586398 RepID=A0AAV2G1L5_9ROSI
MVVSVSGSRSVDWVAKNSINSSGGILIYWFTHLFRKVSIWEGRFCLSVTLEDVRSNLQFSVLVVYGPQDKENKLLFLDEITGFCSSALNPSVLQEISTW